jgi:hypothetical protein
VEQREMTSVHLSGYQARDYEVIDYQMSVLPGTGLQFRGPLPVGLTSGQYFTCVGAAQTFGCFCEQPYPKILSENLGIPALNLGYGGAGPQFFNTQQPLVDYINKGKFLVLQAMSGRSQSNSLFDCDGLELLRRRSDGIVLGANEAYGNLLSGPNWVAHLPPKKVFRFIARQLRVPRVKKLVSETRSGWLINQQQFLGKIKVPVVFLWFSKRTPDYTESYRSLRALFGEFPQLVNRPMVESVRDLCDEYVEVVTQRGSPQPLFNRFTHVPTTVNPGNDRNDLDLNRAWTHNIYYPSPEMQEDAAAALLPICKKYIQ